MARVLRAHPRRSSFADLEIQKLFDSRGGLIIRANYEKVHEPGGSHEEKLIVGSPDVAELASDRPRRAWAKCFLDTRPDRIDKSSVATFSLWLYITHKSRCLDTILALICVSSQ